MLCQIILLPNINFLISKQNKTPKLDLKMMKQETGIANFRHTLPFEQANRALKLKINTVNRYISTSASINCIYSLASFCFDTNILNRFSCLVYAWFQYLVYKFKRHGKLHLNSHPSKNFLSFASGYLVKLCNFCPHLSLETVFPALTATSLLNKFQHFFSWKLAIFKSQVGSPSFTDIPRLKESPHNLIKY